MWTAPRLQCPAGRPAVDQTCQPSHPPSRQRGLRARRIVLDPVNRLPAQARRLGDLRSTDRLLPQHVAHGVELLPGEAGLAADACDTIREFMRRGVRAVDPGAARLTPG